MTRFLPLALLLLVSSPAMAVDFSAVLNDDSDQPIKYCAEQAPGPANLCKREEPLTLGVAIRNALYANFPDEQNLSGEEKFKRAVLAVATKDKGEVKISAEDTALCKKLIAKLYGPLIVYRAWSLLDPK